MRDHHSEPPTSREERALLAAYRRVRPEPERLSRIWTRIEHEVALDDSVRFTTTRHRRAWWIAAVVAAGLLAAISLPLRSWVTEGRSTTESLAVDSHIPTSPGGRVDEVPSGTRGNEHEVLAEQESSADTHDIPPSDRDAESSSAVVSGTRRATERRRPVGERTPLDTPASADSISSETQLLHRARRALSAGEPAGAVSALDEHARLHPRGALTEEREALRAIARCSLGELQAQRVFLEAFPSSPLAERVRRACTSSEEVQTESTDGARQ